MTKANLTANKIQQNLMSHSGIQIGMLMKTGSISLASSFLIYVVSFSSRKFHKNYQMSDKINSNICSVLRVYNIFHQIIKYGHQRNHILQDLTELEI